MISFKRMVMISFSGRLKIAALLCLLLTAGGVMFGCGSNETGRGDVQNGRFTLQGKVVSVDKEQKQATIDHEEVKGFMEAMTMAYTVKDERGLQAIAPGDRIRATLIVKNGVYWLEDVSVTQSASQAAPPAGPTKKE